MDIIKNGRDACDESQFYYYAARSYIHLSCLDSAVMVKNLIPNPVTAQDSMNHYLLMAELASARASSDSAVYQAKVERIQRQMAEKSLTSRLENMDLNIDMQHQKDEVKQHAIRRLIAVISIILATAGLLLFIASSILKKKVNDYQRQLVCARQEMDALIKETEAKFLKLESNNHDQMNIIAENERIISSISERNSELEALHVDLHEQINSIVKKRLSVLNELYNSIHVKTSTSSGNQKRIIPLISLIKELNENKQIRDVKLKDSFWDKLNQSVDEEYQGLASYVEKKYPGLSVKDKHLFLLMCANISNQIIKICMGYTNDATVSKNKKKLMTETLGLVITLDEFIEIYIQGKMNKNSPN